MDRLANQVMESGGHAVFSSLSTDSRLLASALQEYLLVTIYYVVVTLIPVTILLLLIPLFLVVVLVAVVDGFNRRYAAAYESSFLYHHVIRFVKPAFYVSCVVYLS
ncbi:DUF4400 domain-containing protein [Pantoea agglomerans]|uniref:DUF4400 domain-containing protein n=1 Tax=Enterobacter agglomerans TaxID=549 RepID=UPI003FD21413